jgi:hypothetical protein
MAGSRKGGSATTEIVLGSASKALAKAKEEILVAVGQIQNLDERGDELSLKISNKEEEIKGLEVQFAERKRQLNVQLELDVKADKMAVVNSVLNEEDKIAVNRFDFQGLQTEVTTLKKEMDTKVQAEVAKTKAIMERNFENEKKLQEANYSAKEADNKSKIGVLEQQKTFLEAQNKQLIDQLNAEREAGIKRAQAGAIGNINLGNQNSK